MLRRLFLTVLLALAAQAQPAPPPLPPLSQQVGPILQALSQISGWKIERSVPAEMLSREKFRKTMEESMKQSNAKEIHAEETALKMFGLVPQNFDLVGSTLDLISEQVAAYYDYKKKRLFVLDAPPGESSADEQGEEQLTLAHELAHALADQHHPLGKYMSSGSPDDDASSARQAVMEGQATWLSWAYMNERRGGKGEVPAQLLDRVAGSAGATGDQYPALSAAPLYLRDSLIFPYSSGTRFEDAIFRKLGQAGFDQVFQHPPASTQQILHPSEYFEGLLPVTLKPPELKTVIGKDAGDFRVLEEGVRGEFDYSALLRQYTSEAEGAAAAAHIRGDIFRLYESKRDKHPVLFFVTEWDSPGSARRFMELYRRVLTRKWKQLEIASDSDDGFAGTGDSGKFQVHLSGSTVQAVEGLR